MERGRGWERFTGWDDSGRCAGYAGGSWPRSTADLTELRDGDGTDWHLR